MSGKKLKLLLGKNYKTDVFQQKPRFFYERLRLDHCPVHSVHPGECCGALAQDTDDRQLYQPGGGGLHVGVDQAGSPHRPILLLAQGVHRRVGLSTEF